MIRTRWVAAAIVLIGVAWMPGISYINSRQTTLDVRVSPAVEQVQFFAETEPNVPVAQIVTHGLDTRAAVELPNAAQHSLWTQSGPRRTTYQLKTICLRR